MSSSAKNLSEGSKDMSRTDVDMGLQTDAAMDQQIDAAMDQQIVADMDLQIVAEGDASQKAKLTVFHLFSKLPEEVRRMIWKLNLPGPRIVYVGFDPRGHNLYSSTKVPANLRVNKEARNEAQNPELSWTYTSAFAMSSLSSLIPFNFASDTLYIGVLNRAMSTVTCRFLHNLSITDREKVRSVAIHIFDNKRALCKTIIKVFPNLTKITFAIEDVTSHNRPKGTDGWEVDIYDERYEPITITPWFQNLFQQQQWDFINQKRATIHFKAQWANIHGKRALPVIRYAFHRRNIAGEEKMVIPKEGFRRSNRPSKKVPKYQEDSDVMDDE